MSGDESSIKLPKRESLKLATLPDVELPPCLFSSSIWVAFLAESTVLFSIVATDGKGLGGRAGKGGYDDEVVCPTPGGVV